MHAATVSQMAKKGSRDAKAARDDEASFTVNSPLSESALMAASARFRSMFVFDVPPVLSTQSGR
jgi:hypothetical protein